MQGGVGAGGVGGGGGGGGGAGGRGPACKRLRTPELDNALYFVLSLATEQDKLNC